MNIKGKRFLLTGATGGIGKELAKQLDAAGAELILVGRNTQALYEISHSLNHATCLRADLAKEADLNELAQVLKNERLDGLINAAGLNQFSTLENTTAASIQSIMQTNLTGPIILSQLLLPNLRRQPEALLLNIGSTFGSIGYAGYSAYCGSKFGLRGFTESLRRELADTSIKVLYVAPRATTTPMNSDVVQRMNKQLSVHEDGPELVARTIVKAIESERASTYLGWPEKFFARLNSVLPSIVDKSLKKQLPTIKSYATQQNPA